MAIEQRNYDPAIMYGAQHSMTVDLGDVLDSNENEILEFDAVSSAVNYVAIANSATGSAPDIYARGDDTNIGLDLNSKGTGDITFWTGAGSREVLILKNTASAVNEVTITPAATGSAPKVAASGDDTNAGLDLSSKGTGSITLWTGDGSREVIIGVNTASAVNEVTITPAATGNLPQVAASGDDTNVGLDISSKGTGNVEVNANSVNRAIFNGVAKTITDGSATDLFEVAIAQGSSIGGYMQFLVQADDGTDYQAISGILTYAAVNKAGTVTETITYDTANEAKAVSSSTLTLSFTAAEDNADAVMYKLQPTGGLTETTYTIKYTLFPIVGAVTIQ